MKIESQLAARVERADADRAASGPARIAPPGAGAWAPTLAVIGVAFALFASLGLTGFGARVTDLGALRVADGAVPYRDFWTMYAPGSIVVLAAAFKAFGRELIVSNLLGIVTSVLAVGAFHRYALRLLDARAATGAALLFALAFFNAGYSSGFGSYPPTILLSFMAATLIADHARDGSSRRLLGAGACLGAAICFKHDVAAYLSLSAFTAVMLTTPARRLRAAALLVAPAVLVVAIPLVVLLGLGAGADMLRDLLVFPLGDFRYVRPEEFPLLPDLRAGSFVELGENVVWWTILNVPTLVVLVSLPSLARSWRGLSAAQRSVALFALASYPLVWSAAHVQANTHKVSMAAFAALLGAAGLWTLPSLRGHAQRRRRRLLALAAAIWVLALLPLPAYRAWTRWSGGVDRLGLAGTAGIRLDRASALIYRDLAAAIKRAPPPASPLLVLGRRNDVLIYAHSVPYWLSPRRMVTRHHELHPAITDTEEVQRRMLADIAEGPLPVVVREHRFEDEVLDFWKASYLAHGVPVGAELLDRWVAANYRSAGRYGMYEVMAPLR